MEAPDPVKDPSRRLAGVITLERKMQLERVDGQGGRVFWRRIGRLVLERVARWPVKPATGSLGTGSCSRGWPSPGPGLGRRATGLAPVLGYLFDVFRPACDRVALALLGKVVVVDPEQAGALVTKAALGGILIDPDA